MEAQLREYRALRRRKELIENAKEKLEQSKEKIYNFIVPKIFRDMEKDKKEDEHLLLENEEEAEENAPCLIMDEQIEPGSENDEDGSIVKENEESWRYFLIKWSLYTIIWLTLYGMFLKIQFGAVFFVISILIAICLNTRTGPKKEGEVSAYSVFNEKCTSINGTLKAEQFEREIRYGPGTVRVY